MSLFKKGLSIRWKLAAVSFLLVFVAIAVIGGFVLQRTEKYYVATLSSNISAVSGEGKLLSTLESYDSLTKKQAEVQSDIDAWAKSMDMDIFVVDESFNIIASNTASTGRNAIDVLDQAVLLAAFSGNEAERAGQVDSGDTTIQVMNKAFPVRHDEEISGVLYLRADMTSVYDNVRHVRRIFAQGMILALAITMLLGYVVAGSITDPIKEITDNAEQIASGDFEQGVEGRSNDEIGHLAAMLNHLRTELNANISEMSNEKAKLETILRYMEDGLIAMDLSGKIIHANPAAASIIRMPMEALEQTTYDQAVRGLKEDLRFSDLVERSAEGPVAETFTTGGFSYAIRYTRFKDEAGEDVGIIMIIQDITERQKLENMQMDFVANVSHELKTPLTTIKSYTETILDGVVEDEETIKSFLGVIDGEADRMTRLVKELLQLSRLDYKQEQWKKETLSLIPLLASSVRKVELTAKQKEQHMNCLFNPEDEIWVNVDRDGMDQVFLNLLSNAIKYTKEGGRIDVDAYVQGNKAQITVADNGIGIPESEVSRVFERFFRVDKARSRAAGGTGLGLAITKQIVEEHGGSIELVSREGKGSTFTVNLPLAEV